MPVVRHWSRLSSVLLVAALVLGFVATHTSWLQPHGLAIDQEIATDVRTPWLTSVMRAASFLASPPVAGVLLAAGCGVLLWRRRPTAAVATFLVVAVGWTATLVVKVVVGRDRPPVALVHSLAPETGSTSYPSGHTAFACSAAVAVWFLVRGSRWSRPVAVLGAVVVAVVGFSRLYLGVHYPGDVVGSALVAGGAIVLLTGVWHRYLEGWLASLPVLARFAAGGRAPVATGEGHDVPAGGAPWRG
jgi:undecaprenyl-diphosphatase